MNSNGMMTMSPNMMPGGFRTFNSFNTPFPSAFSQSLPGVRLEPTFGRSFGVNQFNRFNQFGFNQFDRMGFNNSLFRPNSFQPSFFGTPVGGFNNNFMMGADGGNLVSATKTRINRFAHLSSFRRRSQ